jgi:hypothetical protein
MMSMDTPRPYRPSDEEESAQVEKIDNPTSELDFVSEFQQYLRTDDDVSRAKLAEALFQKAEKGAFLDSIKKQADEVIPQVVESSEVFINETISENKEADRKKESDLYQVHQFLDSVKKFESDMLRIRLLINFGQIALLAAKQKGEGKTDLINNFHEASFKVFADKILSAAENPNYNPDFFKNKTKAVAQQSRQKLIEHYFGKELTSQMRSTLGIVEWLLDKAETEDVNILTSETLPAGLKATEASDFSLWPATPGIPGMERDKLVIITDLIKPNRPLADVLLMLYHERGHEILHKMRRLEGTEATDKVNGRILDEFFAMLESVRAMSQMPEEIRKSVSSERRSALKNPEQERYLAEITHPRVAELTRTQKIFQGVVCRALVFGYIHGKQQFIKRSS